MKRYLSFVIFVAALALPTMALAQGSGSTSPEARKNDPAFGVTRTVTGKVVAFKSGESLVVQSGGIRHEFKLARETKAPSSLKKGEAVKVIYRPSDQTAVEVLKDNSAS